VANTLDSEFGIEGMEEALRRYEKPEIFNTELGPQFMSRGFVEMVEPHGI